MEERLVKVKVRPQTALWETRGRGDRWLFSAEQYPGTILEEVSAVPYSPAVPVIVLPDGTVSPITQKLVDMRERYPEISRKSLLRDHLIQSIETAVRYAKLYAAFHFENPVEEVADVCEGILKPTIQWKKWYQQLQ